MHLKYLLTSLLLLNYIFIMTSQIIKGYNVYNSQSIQLQNNFKAFLTSSSKSPVTIKNYLSDLRHFLGWIATLDTSSDENNFVLKKVITSASIDEYRNHLIQTSVPIVTINRRLATVRIFLLWLYNEGAIESNYSQGLHNVQTLPKAPSQNSKLKQLITDYSKNLDTSNQVEIEKELVDFFAFTDDKAL